MAQDTLQFVALLGSLRRRSVTLAIANTLDELAPDDVQVCLLERIDALPHFNEDVADAGLPPAVAEMAAAISRADAVVIVSPENASSLPGPLKNALDWISRAPSRPFSRKPTAIQTSSPESGGGILAQAHLRQVLAYLDAVVLNGPAVAMPELCGADEVEASVVRHEEVRRSVGRQLAALADLARCCRAAARRDQA